MSLNGREKRFYTSFVPSGHSHTFNFCMTSSKQRPTLHPSIIWLPGGCHFHQHSSPCCDASIALHHPPLLLVPCLPEQPRTKYSINYDTKRLVMTLFFWTPLCLLCLKETMDRFSPGTSLSLHSQAAALVLCSALWLTCGVTLCVCLCCVGKEQSFKWKKNCLSFLKNLKTVKENVVFLPPPPPASLKQIEITKQGGSMKWQTLCAQEFAWFSPDSPTNHYSCDGQQKGSKKI